MVAENYGQYRTIRRVGAGGMGEVWLAEDSEGRQVALKVLQAGADTHVLRRFRREIQILSRIRHPNVLRVIDWEMDDPPAYLVVEYIDGKTLGERLKDGPLRVEAALTMAHEIASALRLLHEQDVLHRDLKPRNVMFRADGSSILLDFGLARDLNQTRLTAEAGFVGTPRYIPPEVFRGQEADERADIYGLGLLLYQALTGKLPFAAEHAADLMGMIVNGNLPPAQSLNRKVSRRVQAFLDDLIAPDPNQRYSSMREVLDDLTRLMVGKRPLGAARNGAGLASADETELPVEGLPKSRRAAGRDEPSHEETRALCPIRGEERDRIEGAAKVSGRRARKLGTLLWAAVLVAILALTGLFVVKRGGEPAVVAKLLHVEIQPAVGALRLAWKTDRPIRTVLALTDGIHGQEETYEIPGQLAHSHKMTIRGLSPGASYGLRIRLGPKCFASPRKLRLPEVFRVSRIHLDQEESKGGCKLRMRTSLPIEFVRLETAHATLDSRCTRQANSLRISLPSHPPWRDLPPCRIVVKDATGREHDAYIPPQPSPLRRALEGFSPERLKELTDRVERGCLQLTAKNRRKDLCKVLGASPIVARWRVQRESFRQALADSVMSLPEKMRLVQLVLPLDFVDAFARRGRLKMPLGVRKQLLTLFPQETGKNLRPHQGMLLFDRSWPKNDPLCLKSAAKALSTKQGKSWLGEALAWTAGSKTHVSSFTLPASIALHLRWVQLHLRFAKPPFGYVLYIAINDAPPFPVHFQGRRPEALAGFPPGMLRTGLNRIRFSVKNLYMHMKHVPLRFAQVTCAGGM